MPTIDENRSHWDRDFNWENYSEQWSSYWGSADNQWKAMILPRIRSFLPASTILEIGPGHGRWTEYLKGLCTNLIVVDLSAKCIKVCRERFHQSPHISYFVNDGKSLDMVPENSIDLVFSFDALVHAEDEVIRAYLSQLPAKLKQNGAAFLHHSNLGEYAVELGMQRKIRHMPRLLAALKKLGILDELTAQWRDPSMTALKMQEYARENGLQCLNQELINWNSRRSLIDCFSTIIKRDPACSRENKVMRNAGFMKEAKSLC